MIGEDTHPGEEVVTIFVQVKLIPNQNATQDDFL